MTAPADLKGCACWGGLDLSNVSDITAYVLLFHENDRFQLLPHFWIPEEKMLEKVRKENINYDKWVAAGYVTVTPGNVIDYDLRTSAYDRWNSTQTIIDLQNEGMECNPFGQGYGSMSAPTKEFEKLVLTGKIEHFGNPVLRWMLASTLVKTDPAGNIKPDKEKSTQKIDGIVAAIMALGEWMTAQADERTLLPPHLPYLLLEGVEKTGGMGAVHLRMMELERDGERRPEQPPPVSAPDHERIVENTAVHAHRTVDLILRQSGGADHHAVCQVVVLARFGHLPRKPQIVVVEPPQIVRKGNVARTHLAPPIDDDGIDGDRVVAHQLAADGKHIKLLDAGGRPADAPAHQHIEFQTIPAAQTDQTRDVERPEKSDHRHGRRHPHLESIGAGRCSGIDFLHGYFFAKVVYFCHSYTFPAEFRKAPSSAPPTDRRTAST